MTRTEVPPAQRMILNSNQGIVNIIESETIRKDMWHIVDEIFSKLTEDEKQALSDILDKLIEK